MHKRSIEDLEAGAGNPRGIQKHGLIVKEWGQESQSPPGAERGKAGKGQHEGFVGLSAAEERVGET